MNGQAGKYGKGKKQPFMADWDPTLNKSNASESGDGIEFTADELMQYDPTLKITKVQAPDGRIVKVQHPVNASEAEIVEYAKKNANEPINPDDVIWDAPEIDESKVKWDATPDPDVVRRAKQAREGKKIAKVQMPDGRIAVFEVPVGMAEDEFMNYVRNSNRNPEEQEGNKPPAKPDVTGADTELKRDENGNIVLDDPISNMVNKFQSDIGGAWGDVAVNAVKNTPGSAVEFGKAIAQPFIHPVQTYESMKSLARGLFHKLTPGEQPEEMAVDALAQELDNRYGTMAKFKETVASDPVGALADLSMLLTGAGGVAKISSTGKLAQEAGQVMQKAGNMVEPMNLAKQATVGLATKAIPEGLPAKMYESAAKFSTRKGFTVKDRQRAVQTALENNFLPKEGEIAKIWTKISENSDKVDAIIDQATSEGKTISKQSLIAEIPELKTKPHPQMTRRNKTLDNLTGDFLDAFPDEIPVDQVQALKRTIHKELENHYRNTAPRPAVINEFNAAIAHAAMNELERLYPVLNTINKESSDYIHLVKALEQSAKRVGNKNIVSLDTIIKGAAGYSIGDVGGLIGGLALGLLDVDGVKARVATVLHKAKQNGIKARPAIFKNTVYGAGRTAEEIDLDRFLTDWQVNDDEPAKAPDLNGFLMK